MIMVMIVRNAGLGKLIGLFFFITVRTEENLKVRRTQAAFVDMCVRQAKAADAEAAQLTFEISKHEAGVEQCANEHITADAGKTIEIRDAMRSGFHVQPLT